MKSITKGGFEISSIFVCV